VVQLHQMETSQYIVTLHLVTLHTFQTNK